MISIKLFVFNGALVSAGVYVCVRVTGPPQPVCGFKRVRVLSKRKVVNECGVHLKLLPLLVTKKEKKPVEI